MRPVTVSQTGAGSSAPVPLDTYLDFGVGIGCTVTGTVNYTVQHTFDDPFGPGFASAVWLDHPTVAAETTNQDGNYAYGVRAVRVTVNSGTGTVRMTVVQTGGGS